MLIIYNNPIKGCFSNKKYPSIIIIINTITQIVKCTFLIEKAILIEFLKIGAQNQLTITFCSDLVCNKTLKAHMKFCPSISYYTLNLSQK